MAEQKRRLVMDIVAAPPSPAVPVAKKSYRARLVDIGRSMRVKRKVLLYVLGTLVILFIGTVLFHSYIARPKERTGAVIPFPASVVGEINAFHFYYFRSGLQTDYVLQPSSINYLSSVLVFDMKNGAGNTLAVTEEALPPSFNTSTLNATTQFNTAYGQGLINGSSLQTTGSLITQNNTWIIINAPQPVNTATMEQMIKALVPVKQ